MLTRRSLLLTSGTAAIGALLAGCNTTSSSGLRIQLLKGSLPPQLPGEFRKGMQRDTKLEFVSRTQLTDLFADLRRWKLQSASPPSSPPIADLLTLGDYWLAPAIQQGLIQPLMLNDLPGWKQLEARWQDLVRRNEQGNSAADGEIWAAPYRWGGMAIAYRKDLFQPLGWTPSDWSDLWRPELKRRIALPDSPRTVIGIALKTLGKSINTPDLESLADLPATLSALQGQVKFYSSTAYLQPLILDDIWLAVGSSMDILPLVERDPRIAAVFPASGTVLFADLWVKPAGAKTDQAIAQQWIDFCWKPDVATRLSLLGTAASPALSQTSPSALPSALQNNPLLVPNASTLERSEFLSPVSKTTLESYRRLWETMRI